MTKGRKWICLLVSVLLVFSTGACAPSHDDKAGTSKNIFIGYDYALAKNLSQMTEAARVIVIGKYTGYDSSWNMARDPDDISKEDEDDYTEGHLYKFAVEEILKGELAGEDILVNHRYSETCRVDKISFMMHDPLYIAPEIGASYILFLTENGAFGHYYGAIEPFSIKISPDDTVELQSNLIGRTEHFTETVTADDDRRINVSISAYLLEDGISGQTFDSVLRQIRERSAE